jgi:hypothetical protein
MRSGFPFLFFFGKQTQCTKREEPNIPAVITDYTSAGKLWLRDNRGQVH